VITLLAAVAVYTATNVDNFLVLLAFSADPAYRAREIAVGQALGLGGLVLAGLAGARLAARLAPPLVGLLGFVPLTLGLRRLIGPRRAGATSARPGGAHVLAVALTALGNGGDNVAAYVPFFARQQGLAFLASLAVFAGLTGLWCLAARRVVQVPTIGSRLARQGRALVGAVMVALGAAILLRSGTLGLFLVYS
jgi:cadmium resistance protein CadD (predicted permease)